MVNSVEGYGEVKENCIGLNPIIPVRYAIMNKRWPFAILRKALTKSTMIGRKRTPQFRICGNGKLKCVVKILAWDANE